MSAPPHSANPSYAGESSVEVVTMRSTNCRGVKVKQITVGGISHSRVDLHVFGKKRGIKEVIILGNEVTLQYLVATSNVDVPKTSEPHILPFAAMDQEITLYETNL